MNKIRIAFECLLSFGVLILIVLAIALFWRVVFDCKADAAGLQTCVDVLVSTKDKAIITVQPAGHQWGTKEGAPKYRVERFCVDYPADPYRLSIPWLSGETIVTDHRFESDGYGGIYDRKTGQYLTATEAAEVTP